MTETPTQVRDSDINALQEKVANSNYGKYLKRVLLRKLRGFKDREVNFDFPVTALVGPNGGGKPTILGAAAMLYKSVKPRRFFAKSGKYDESMKDWAIEFDLIDKDLNERIMLQRTASFKALKWNRNAVDREVLIFGVARTVPATERGELARALGGTYEAKSEAVLPERVAQEVEKILGKPIALFEIESMKAAPRSPTPRADGNLDGVHAPERGAVDRIIAIATRSPGVWPDMTEHGWRSTSGRRSSSG